MNLLLKLFNRNKKNNQVLFFYCLYCLSLLIVRAQLTNSIYLFFLLWNLFLAGIPYAVTSHLQTLEFLGLSKIKTAGLVIVWLAFIPNSFYIITDLVHLVNSEGSIFWLDLIILSSYALAGFAFGILSLLDFEKLARQFISERITNLIIPIICFLCGVGIYIGRILRYNSWDIISNPVDLTIDLVEAAFSLKSILFAVHFGVFIYFSFLIKKNVNTPHPHHGNTTF